MIFDLFITRLSALSQETRLHIFKALALSPDAMTVSEIASTLNLRNQLVSSHLGVLSRAGLIFGVNAGNWRIYRVDTGVLAATISDLFEIHKGALAHAKTPGHQINPTEGSDLLPSRGGEDSPPRDPRESPPAS